MSDLVATRTQLVAALDVVLPGRAFANPPTSGRYVTPSVFVELSTGGGDIDEPTATFPVWVIADGAIESQIAAHDSIVWNCVLALYPFATRIIWRPMVVAGYRATVIEADVPLDAYGLCGAPPPVAFTFSS